MSGPINIDPKEVEYWQIEWETDYRPRWIVGKDGKYYPKPVVKKCLRKDIDDVIATVR